MKKMMLPLSLIAALSLASCAPKYTQATARPVTDLNCAEIKDELGKLASIRAEAESKKGVSKENVLFALFFWPGIVFNEVDNRDVITKVDTRTAELVKAQSAKSCPAN
ncbi:hypothetical protein [uncultured Deinococcus sp.]|uniref:Lipoprotein n=3 Tax=Deinococcus TaxID=1298 RepID=H8GTS2_DEIGI|nr:hypothetical protein [uncultured Deinococcus sp.]AFD26562.1 hypothetical protein DGo_CA2635 [Deinococcus gobiensis I-0]